MTKIQEPHLVLMAPDGRIIIPQELRQAIGLKNGGYIGLELNGKELRLFHAKVVRAYEE